MNVLVYITETGVQVFDGPEAAKRAFAGYLGELPPEEAQAFRAEIDHAWKKLGNEGDLKDGDYIKSVKVEV